MSFSIQKLRSLLPGGQQQPSAKAATTANQQRQTDNLEPEIGFQISIETSQQNTSTTTSTDAVYQKTTVPELNVNLVAARHLPALFGFKIVQGYLIKVKLFPGSKRLDSSIQTNSWPKFNENFKFPLVPEIKPSLKHSSRRSSKIANEFTPEELFAGHFVVFTVYALLELPPANFNRLSKTYRSLRDKSSNLVQKVVESDKPKEDKENAGKVKQASAKKVKSKDKDSNTKEGVPALTISESRRNIGSVTCYLEPKIFKRNSRTGVFATEELWLPIKDITKTTPKGPSNTLANSAKGIVELLLEVKDLSEKPEVDAGAVSNGLANKSNGNLSATTTTTTTTQTAPTGANSVNGLKTPHWKRMKQKIGIGGNSLKGQKHDFVLNVTTARMRCTHTVKDELEATAGSVYVKTTVFEHGIYIGAWKSDNFYPSLSTKWNVGEAATLAIPLLKLDNLDNIVVRTTLATKTKMGKKLVLGTVLIGALATGSGQQQMQLLRELPLNEPVAMWHCYQ